MAATRAPLRADLSIVTFRAPSGLPLPAHQQNVFGA
jgi:hypothetical protein